MARLAGGGLLVAALAILSLLVVPSAAVQSGICRPYNGTACASILPAGYVLWANNTEDMEKQEKAMQYVADQIKILKPIDPKCYSAFMNYSCTTYFPHCSPALPDTPEWQCKSDCLVAQEACRSIFTVGGHPEDLPKCIDVPNGAPLNTTYPERNCYSMGNGTDIGPVECPAPLVKNPYNGTKVPRTCPAYGGECCFTCPVYHNLYPSKPGAEYEEDVVGKLNTVSFVLLLVVLGLWAGRPNVWQSSRLVTVMFSLLNALGLAGVGAYMLNSKRQDFMCMSEVEDAVNRGWCTFEGISYSFFGQAFSFSEALFNVNLFLTLYLLRDPIPTQVAYRLFAAIWIVAAILNITPYALTGSAHQFGIHCSPGDLKLYRNMSLMPLIAGLIVSIVCGFLNVAYIGKMAYDIFVLKDPRYGAVGGSAATLSSADDDQDDDAVDPPRPAADGGDEDVEDEDEELRASGKAAGYEPTGNPRYDTFVQSWRTALLSFMVATAFLVFVIWWFTDAEPALLSGGGDPASGAAEWGQEWLTCLIRNVPEGQDACAHITKPHVPRFEWVFTTDVMSAIVGIFYFITLGTQISDWMRLSDIALQVWDSGRAWAESKLRRGGEIRLE
ncbi:hypothetical protein DFJ74DRAFT_656329 [Hyaloraphidium curvatum]|nr:hypothetical protein DFJ74DRAFT_656329 [Hyaloraphidium curvatum]